MRLELAVEAVVERIEQRFWWLKKAPFGVAVASVALATATVIVLAISLLSVVSLTLVLYLIIFGLSLVALWLFFLASNVAQVAHEDLRRAGVGLSGQLNELETHVLELKGLIHQLETLMIDHFHRLTEEGTRGLLISKKVLQALEERLTAAEELFRMTPRNYVVQLNELMCRDLVFPTTTLHSVLDEPDLPSLPASQWAAKVDELKQALEREIRSALRQRRQST